MLLRRLVVLALAIPLLVAATWCEAAAQDRRVALVIDADRYRNIPALGNAVNDARSVAARLSQLGFEVVGPVLDPTRQQFFDALEQFDQRLIGAEAGLFFYAGHAVEVERQNLLLPVDAPAARSRIQLQGGAVPVADILRDMQARTRRVILILDACRDNPLADATRGGAPAVGALRGLEPIAGGPSPEGGGRFVVFAAEPGAAALDRLPQDPPGGNGLFTRHLLRAMENPARPITALMSEVRDQVAVAARGAGRQQLPHIDDRMEGSGEFMLARVTAPPPRPAVPAPVQPAVVPQVAQEAIELAFWQSIQNSRNLADFEAYLTRFPNGTFADLARNRVAALRAPPPAAAQPAAMPVPVPPAAAPPAPPAIRALTREEVSTAQGLLNALGFETGGTDGTIGPRSRAALERFARVTLRPDEAEFTTANLTRIEEVRRDFLRLTERGDASPRGVAAATVTGAPARFDRGFAAERANPPDFAEAAYWYGLAAREHEPRAMNLLGLLLVRGQGVAQDGVGASLLWRLAAARGDATAAFNLGAMLERGIGLNRHPGWARFWYEQAAQAGHPQAREAMQRVSR